MGEAVGGRKVGRLTPMTTRADLLLKANRTIDLHARCVHMYEAGRYAGRPVTDTLTSEQFGERYGWHPERMAQDVETAMKHGCAYCGAAYASQADVSFDVIDQPLPGIIRPTSCCAAAGATHRKENTRSRGGLPIVRSSFGRSSICALSSPAGISSSRCLSSTASPERSLISRKTGLGRLRANRGTCHRRLGAGVEADIHRRRHRPSPCE